MASDKPDDLLGVLILEEYGQVNVLTVHPQVTDEERAAAGRTTLQAAFAEAQAENRRRSRAAARRHTLPDGVLIERVARQPAAAELEKRLGNDIGMVWHEGDELTVACRSRAAQAFVGGGFEMTLWPVRDTDIRTVTVRVRDLDRAMLSLRVCEVDEPGNLDRARQIFHTVWLGPAAPPPPPRASAIVQVHDVPSAALMLERRVHVSLPERRPERIVYAADAMIFPEVVRALEADGVVAPTALVGIEPATREGGSIARRWEYAYGANPDRYVAHRRFFTEEVPAWLEQTYGVGRLSRDHSLVCGGSAGGRYASELGVLDADKFGAVISLSSSVGAPILEFAWPNGTPPRYGLGVGTFEDPTGLTRAHQRRLESAGAETMCLEWAGGHDSLAWEVAFVELLRWCHGAR